MTRFAGALQLGAAVLLMIIAATTRAEAAPEAELWARWTDHDPTSTVTIDHGPYDRLLAAYVRAADDGVNRFDYAGISAADRKTLDGYVAILEDVAVSRLNRAEQFAYWVNLYNALTIKVVLDHYPVESIRDIDISPGFFADGPWGAKLATVEGESVTLDDIEHRILRPIWRDPRIHYAVNCASIGCPNLWPAAITPAQADELLDAQARAFINHPRGAEVQDGKLYVSSIYDWFVSDFGGNDAAVIAHLKQFAEPPLRNRFEEIERISGDSYDWSLNDG